VQVIEVPLTMVTPVARALPNQTATAPVKPVPVIVTAVPPPTGPVPGLTPVTLTPELDRAAHTSLSLTAASDTAVAGAPPTAPCVPAGDSAQVEFDTTCGGSNAAAAPASTRFIVFAPV
jgi:hypothetical protein